MDFLKKTPSKEMLCDCYAIHVYLPAEYMDTSYRGSPYYSVIGTKVKFLCCGNIRFFKSEAELQQPEKVKTHPLAIPMLVMSEPAEIDVRDVRFTTGGRVRKCIVLTYFKGDKFFTNTETIKSLDPVMMVLSRLEQGKIDYVPPEVAVEMLGDSQRMNNVNLRIPSEEEEIYVAERYRDPDHPDRKYRYHTGAVDPDATISYNSRVEMHKGSSYSGLFGEDVSNALVAAVNRNDRGIVDEPGIFEALVRGFDMTAYAEGDYSTRADDNAK